MNVRSIIIWLVVSFGLLIGISMLLFRQGQVVEQVSTNINIEGEARNVRGEGEIVIVEFSDFQCPACRASQSVVDQVLAKYEGKVKLVYRHFPLISIHKYAELAAQAAEAAGEQNKFFEYHDLLYLRQEEWSGGSAEKLFIAYAGELGLDVERFEIDMNSPKVRDIVRDDLVTANKLKLTGTPSFFINGRQVSYDVLDSNIESLLGK